MCILVWQIEGTFDVQQRRKKKFFRLVHSLKALKLSLQNYFLWSACRLPLCTG